MGRRITYFSALRLIYDCRINLSTEIDRVTCSHNFSLISFHLKYGTRYREDSTKIKVAGKRLACLIILYYKQVYVSLGWQSKSDPQRDDLACVLSACGAAPADSLQSRRGEPSAFFCLDPSTNPILHACALFNF